MLYILIQEQSQQQTYICTLHRKPDMAYLSMMKNQHVVLYVHTNSLRNVCLFAMFVLY